MGLVAFWPAYREIPHLAMASTIFPFHLSIQTTDCKTLGSCPGSCPCRATLASCREFSRMRGPAAKKNSSSFCTCWPRCSQTDQQHHDPSCTGTWKKLLMLMQGFVPFSSCIRTLCLHSTHTSPYTSSLSLICPFLFISHPRTSPRHADAPSTIFWSLPHQLLIPVLPLLHTARYITFPPLLFGFHHSTHIQRRTRAASWPT